MTHDAVSQPGVFGELFRISSEHDEVIVVVRFAEDQTGDD
jgi:hypothetical protein